MSDIDTFIINQYVFKKKIDADKIRKRVEELAASIRNDYKAAKKMTYIVVLKGAFIFAADLIREINKPSEIIFVDAKSYGMNLKSTGKVVLNLGDLDLEDKYVLIIEDIIDSGRTMKALTDELNRQKPHTMEIAAFLSKPEAREVELDIKYIGYKIPPDFVIGYGLDYAEEGRHLPHIYSKI
jgi:hypoxanthine phosphoribosyltransferase